MFSIDELEAYCKKYPAKLSQAERRLRPSESPEIEGVRKKGYIIGYRLKQSRDSAEIINTAGRPQDFLSKSYDCCYSFKIFKIHSPDCPKVQVKVSQLF